MASGARIVNAFTVDLEEWFQGLTSTNALVEYWPSLESRVVPATRLLLEILEAHRVRATFFVLGYVADRHPELIATIERAGHEIGVHGYYHRFVSRLSPDAFRAELRCSIAAVERVTGKRPLGHRAPYFSINARAVWALDILADEGLRYDSSVFPTRNMLYGFPGAPRFPHTVAGGRLVEFPPSTIRAAGVNWPIAGGFYLRTLPYPLIRAAIKALHRQGRPVIMYIHPWELDCGQHYDRVTARERITHYHGRQGLAAKLHALFHEFTFAPLEELLHHASRDVRAPAGAPPRLVVGSGTAGHIPREIEHAEGHGQAGESVGDYADLRRRCKPLERGSG